MEFFLEAKDKQLLLQELWVLTPKVILLDEPTAALGVTQTKEVLEVIKQLKTNHAVVYISHNLNDVFEVCDRITVLRQGVNIGIYETNLSSDKLLLQ